MGGGNITIYVPGIDGETYNDSLVQLIELKSGKSISCTITNSNVTLDLTTVGVEDQTVETLGTMKVRKNGNYANISYPVTESGPTKITITDINGSQITDIINKEDSYGMNNFNYDTSNLSTAVYLVNITTKNYSKTAKVTGGHGELLAHSTDQPILKIIQQKNQTGRVMKTTEDIPAGSDYKIIVTNPNKHYGRIIYAPRTNQLEDRVTGHVVQDGVDKYLFRDFAEEGNFSMGSNGMGFNGLKTFAPNVDKKNIIRNRGHPLDPQIVTQSDMEYVKNLIETEIFPSVDPKYRPITELQTLSADEPLPSTPGSIVIYPRSTGFYMGSTDTNSDVIIDISYVMLQSNTWSNSQFNNSKLQEIFSAFCAPNQVDGNPNNQRFSYKTVLSSGASAFHLTAMDKKIQKISENYAPKESIDKILGL